MTEIQQRLFELQDTGYRAFTLPLLPGLDPGRVIGVRAPRLRALAKEIRKEGKERDFLSALPHVYFEENGLHAALLCLERDFEECVRELERFLPLVDNWATCDSLNPNVFKKHRAELLGLVPGWLGSEHAYTVRFGLGVLMHHFLDGDFRPEVLDWAAALRSEEYYVNMMIAWYFATALAKQYDAALPYLTQRRLDPKTHSKTIQKAVESYRITDEQKTYLKSLRAGAALAVARGRES